MNSCFNAERFGKYFLFDLKQNWKNAGSLLLVVILCPAALFLADRILQMFGLPIIHMALKITIYACIAVVGSIALPAQAYGYITDRKKGIQWAMLPASVTEKWLSMVLITCIIYPLATAVPYAAIVHEAGVNMFDVNLFNLGMSNGEFSFNIIALTYFGTTASLLFFLLGAVLFKKGKIAYVLLIYFAAGLVFSFLFSTIVIKLPMMDWLESWAHNMTPQKAVNIFNILMSLYYIVINGGFLAATYYRLKTIKY